MADTNGARRIVGRPKRYPYHQDRGAFIPRPDAITSLVAWLNDKASPTLQTEFADARSLAAEADFFKVQPVSFNDPRCCFMVVDALVKSEPRTYIRAVPLAAALQGRYRLWYWDAGVVGRILSGVRGACEEVYRNTLGKGAYEEDEGDLPFALGRDRANRYYVIDPLGGNEGRLWLLKMRGWLFSLSQQQQYADFAGDFTRYIHRDYNAGWMSESCPVAVRGRDAYLGQRVITHGDGGEAGVPVDLPRLDLRRVASQFDGPAPGFEPAGGRRVVG